jgi:hypothetical protein
VHPAGAVLVEDTWCPEYDAARAPLALGITGKVEVRRGDKVVATMNVERAAELTIVENANVGPRVAPWVPFSPYSVPPPAAYRDGVGRVVATSEDGRRGGVRPALPTLRRHDPRLGALMAEPGARH